MLQAGASERQVLFLALEALVRALPSEPARSGPKASGEGNRRR